METKCSVVNCDNKSNPTKVFYKFPMAFDMCMQWVQNTGNQKLVQEFAFGGAQPFEEKFICSDHFLDRDFAIFGQPQSGLRCHAVPLAKKKESEVTDISKPSVNNNPPKKEPETKDISEPSINTTEDTTADRLKCHEIPLTKDLKKEPEVPDMPESGDVEDTKVSYIHDLPVITSIKEEPEPYEIEGTSPLPFTLINPEDENIMSATYEAVSIVSDSAEEPRIIESTLPLPCTVFNLEDVNIKSNLPIIRNPKEEGDIEEVLLPESSLQDDDNVVMDAEDQFEDLSYDSAYPEELTEKSLLMNIKDIEYINPKRKRSRHSKEERDPERKRKDALRQSMARQRETPEHRAIRLEKTRIRAQERRRAESEVETTIRRYKSAVRAAIKRSGETEDEKKQRQEKNKIRAAERRKKMTPKQREEWRLKNRVQTRERRQNESEIKKIVRRYNNALRASLKRSRESPEQRMERRIKDALRAAERRKTETPEEREVRLRKDRERVTLRRMELLLTETPEQREARLKKERERMYRKRHGLKEELSKEDELKNQIVEVPNKETDISHSSLLNFNPIFPTILSMLPPNIEVETQNDV